MTDSELARSGVRTCGNSEKRDGGLAMGRRRVGNGATVASGREEDSAALDELNEWS